MSAELSALVAERGALQRRLDRLSGAAEARVKAYVADRKELQAAASFLELAPKVSARLETLTRQLFGEVLDEIEADLTHAVCEILGQDRRVRSRREIRAGRLSIEFEMEQDGKVEDILSGQGGSVCNILSVGLRLVALSQLDPGRHRPFLVLDEQDCWLRPELVPRFVGLIAAIAARLDLQVLYISHHPVDLFALRADRVFTLAPSREQGVRVAVVPSRAGGEVALPGPDVDGVSGD